MIDQDTSFRMYCAAVTPLGVDSPVGGACSEQEIMPGNVTSIFPVLVAAPAGGENRIRYGKLFYRNTSPPGTHVEQARIFCPNILADLDRPDFINLMSVDHGDDDKVAWVIGHDDGGMPVRDEIALSRPKSFLVGRRKMARVSRVEIRTNDARHNLVSLKHDLIVRAGIGANMYLGKVECGEKVSVGEVEIGVSPWFNDGIVCQTQDTPPPDVAFFKPRDPGESIYVPGTTWNAGDSLGVWLRMTHLSGICRTEYSHVAISIICE